MGIKDIPLSNSSTDPSMAVPVPPALDTIIRTGKGPLKDDPQSGSILKVLMDNGFKDKITDGTAKGKAYSILHAAPSSDFTLVESWDETVADTDGNMVTTPKKNYQFFKITDMPSPAPAPVEPPIAPVMPVPVAQEPEPVAVSLGPTATEMPAPIIPAVPEPVAMTEITDVSKRTEEVAAKIKNGGAGMTADDWQYRNDNWPAIEKILMNKPVQSVTETVPLRPTATPTTTPPSLAEPRDTSPYKGEDTIPAPVMQHHEAKNWLMEKLGQSQANTTEQPTTEPKTPDMPKVSSYDLLKARFAQGSKPTEAIAATPLAMIDKKQTLLESSFGGPLVGDTLELWNTMKSIPARPFIYPTEYAWGTDADGKPVERSLENYPPAAHKLREKITSIVEDLKTKGEDIETMTIGDALEKANALGML